MLGLKRLFVIEEIELGVTARLLRLSSFFALVMAISRGDMNLVLAGRPLRTELTTGR